MNIHAPAHGIFSSLLSRDTLWICRLTFVLTAVIFLWVWLCIIFCNNYKYLINLRNMTYIKLLSLFIFSALSFELGKINIRSSFITSLLCLRFSVQTLECYVCDNQEDNKGKCIQTIKTCDYGEDVCLMEVAWGSTPYWQQGALKQYYVSKRCSTKDHCTNYRKSNMGLCTHIWYQDWKCSECCKGDRCNYYIIVSINQSILPYQLFIYFNYSLESQRRHQ